MQTVKKNGGSSLVINGSFVSKHERIYTFVTVAKTKLRDK